jgi:methyl-accepting chemotaxis protein
MFHSLTQWSIVAKLRLMALFGLGALLGVSGWLIWSAKTQTLQSRQDDTRHAVEVAYGVLEWAHTLETSGQMPREQAQQLAMKAVAKLRYNGREYFWINDMRPYVLMHPIKPELDGKDVSASKDPNGKALFVAFVDKVRTDGQGFVDYQWPKPGQQAPVDKLSFVKGFAPWGWVIGSGIYIDDVQRETRDYLMRYALLLVLTTTAVLLLSGSISRSIVQGLKQAMDMARAIAAGDISGGGTHRKGSDEVGELLLMMDTMRQNLRQMVGVVQEASSNMQTAASEIAAGNTDLSERTEQTSLSLQQTLDSVHHISDFAEQTASSAQEAASLSRQAAETAVQGNAVVSQVVLTMNQIASSSSRIADITGVIDGIAFQTNILALNAAVEAARAGEQGRGFAVVATEVRALAQRSATAAKEIKDLIGASVERVAAGSELVGSAGNTMQKVVSSVQQVQELVNSMRDVNAELTTSVHAIHQAMSDLTHNTHQNAALVEQSAASAHNLDEQADRLTKTVAVFRL